MTGAGNVARRCVQLGHFEVGTILKNPGVMVKKEGPETRFAKYACTHT